MRDSVVSDQYCGLLTVLLGKKCHYSVSISTGIKLTAKSVNCFIIASWKKPEYCHSVILSYKVQIV